MNAFAALYTALDATTKTNLKVAAIEQYLRTAPPADAAWAIYFLRGGKLRAPFSSRLLRTWAAEAAAIPDWLFAECYESVGDLAETAALLLPASPNSATNQSLDHWITERLLPLRSLPEPQQKAALLEAWSLLPTSQRFVYNKLITGAFRVGVSEGLVLRALAAATSVPQAVLAHRLAGSWQPSPAAWQALTSLETSDAISSQPYPFFLSHPIQNEPDSLGPITDWLLEYKWDGIRAQLIRRAGSTFIWSRGGEQLTDRFPEILSSASALPDGTVIDGEILAWRDNGALPFADLQQRITRKKPTRAFLDKVPTRLIAFDLLEWQSQDLRTQPLAERRALLASLPVTLSPTLQASSWSEAHHLRASARQVRAEGLMLKRSSSPYGTGREKGNWWKWKLDPFSVDAVLINAQRGHGRRASLFTDYTFAVWDQGKLVPFAKAYSGLTDAEFRQVDAFIRAHTLEKFGPVSAVTPELVFEIAFEGIQRSPRHKSGIAVRFPRMARWRTDKSAADADSLDTVKALLNP
jgi:DNA ligase-1